MSYPRKKEKKRHALLYPPAFCMEKKGLLPHLYTKRESPEGKRGRGQGGTTYDRERKG